MVVLVLMTVLSKAVLDLMGVRDISVVVIVDVIGTAATREVSKAILNGIVRYSWGGDAVHSECDGIVSMMIGMVEET